MDKKKLDPKATFEDAVFNRSVWRSVNEWAEFLFGESTAQGRQKIRSWVYYYCRHDRPLVYIPRDPDNRLDKVIMPLTHDRATAMSGVKNSIRKLESAVIRTRNFSNAALGVYEDLSHTIAQDMNPTIELLSGLQKIALASERSAYVQKPVSRRELAAE